MPKRKISSGGRIPGAKNEVRWYQEESEMAFRKNRKSRKRRMRYENGK
jgi:hypothetical protein